VIFVSIALLVVAAIALGIGIASSSVPPLVISVLATLAAGGVLWASFIHYRKEAADAGGAVTGLGGNQARQPGYPGVYQEAAPDGPAAPVPVASPRTAVPQAWDDMPADDAAAVVEAFNLDELHDLRRYEVEHEHRSAVLGAIDERIETLVVLRRRLATR
jgi:hypothetical protein